MIAAAIHWDIIIVALIAAVPATIGAWNSVKARKHTRSKNGGEGMNDDLAHLVEDFGGFKEEVRDQWRFHLGFHHSDRDIVSEVENLPPR